MLLWLIDVEFENTFIVSEKSNVFRFISRLYGCLYKILRLPKAAAEHSIAALAKAYY